MIKKISILIVIIFISLWLVGAFYLKSQLINFIGTNMIKDERITAKINYKNVNIGGFPFSWNIKVIEPEMMFELPEMGISDKISIDYLSINFNYMLNKIRFVLPKISKSEIKSESVNESIMTKSEKDVILDCHLAYSLYRYSKLKENFARKISYDLPKTIYFINGKKEYIVSRSKLLFQQDSIYKASLQFDNKMDEFESSNLDVDSVQININLDGVFETNGLLQINFNQLLISLDEAQFSLKGKLVANQDTKLDGSKFEVEILKYQDLVDFIPETDDAVKMQLKQVIARTVMDNLDRVPTNEDIIKFDVIFSKRDLKIGNIYLPGVLE